MKNDKRINFRIEEELYDLMSKKAKEKEINITSYIISLIRSDLGMKASDVKEEVNSSKNQVNESSEEGYLDRFMVGSLLTIIKFLEDGIGAKLKDEDKKSIRADVDGVIEHFKDDDN